MVEHLAASGRATPVCPPDGPAVAPATRPDASAPLAAAHCSRSTSTVGSWSEICTTPEVAPTRPSERRGARDFVGDGRRGLGRRIRSGRVGEGRRSDAIPACPRRKGSCGCLSIPWFDLSSGAAHVAEILVSADLEFADSYRVAIGRQPAAERPVLRGRGTHISCEPGDLAL
jgi:hypothetical protein